MAWKQFLSGAIGAFWGLTRILGVVGLPEDFKTALKVLDMIPDWVGIVALTAFCIFSWQAWGHRAISAVNKSLGVIREIGEKRERRRARIQAEEQKRVEIEEHAKSIVRMHQPGGVEYETWLEKIAGRGDQAADAIEAALDFVTAKRVFDNWRYAEHPRAGEQAVAAMIARLRAEGPTPETETFLLAELEHDSTVDSMSVSYGKGDPDYEGDDHRYEWMVIGIEDMWTRGLDEKGLRHDAG